MLFEPALSLTHSLALGICQMEAEVMWLVVSSPLITPQYFNFVMSGKTTIFCGRIPDKDFEIIPEYQRLKLF
ncbi:MAG: hypothetical protein NTV80_02905 [Verrucomicrobia bacterium]|nr:hypothetical protein [Verrucomicrobiota bacterium]